MQKTVKLYDNTISLNFNDKARNRYTIEETGKSPVGVTTVLSNTIAKPGLLTWSMTEAIAHLKVNIGDWEGAAKAYLTKSDTGKNTGTLVHSAIEAFLNGEEHEVPIEAVKALVGFREWFGEQKAIKPLGVEQIVYSQQFDYAGTLDGIMELDGQVILFDLKTNNASRIAPLGIYAEMYLQLGAYSFAYSEETGKNVDDVAIIRVGKDGVVNTLRASELGLAVLDCEGAWLSVLSAYKFLTPLTKTLKEKTSATGTNTKSKAQPRSTDITTA